MHEPQIASIFGDGDGRVKKWRSIGGEWQALRIQGRSKLPRPALRCALDAPLKRVALAIECMRNALRRAVVLRGRILASGEQVDRRGQAMQGLVDLLRLAQ